MSGPRSSARSFLIGAARICGGLIGLCLVLAAFFSVWAQFRADRVFSAPLPDIRSVSDSAVIARGRYLVHGPGHCADCHAPVSEKSKVDAGLEASLSGGYSLKIFLGEIIATNITPDRETGIGGIGDGELARFFRTGIDHRGRVGLPMMMYADLTDGDLTAIISYLRSVPPARHSVPPSRYNLLGKITKAFFLEPFSPTSAVAPQSAATPVSPDPPNPGQDAVPEPGTRAYGRYLVEAVANCASCHTARNMKTGEYTGPRLAGGLVFRKSDDPSRIAISPNLTPDPNTGAMTGWSRNRFIERMRKGNLRDWSPMPWGPFSRMTDEDLGAIYLYLTGLDPVYRDNFTNAEEKP